MKRIAIVVALLAAGCATKGALKKEVEPLGQRLTAVEQKQATTDAQLAQMSSKLDAQTAELQKLRQEVAASTTASQEAAARAESAAEKSSKAFELMQTKGATTTTPKKKK